MADSDFPYELHRVPGAQALERLAALRAEGRGTPVILGDDEAFESIVECLEMNDEHTPQELIEAAGRVDIDAWATGREIDDPDCFEIEPAPWPADGQVESMPSIISHCDILTREPYPEVLIAVLPTEPGQSWQAPCLLRIGGWNSVPTAEVHSALFRLWHTQWGATVACITDDVIEFTVERPPQTREEAMELARLQFIYCPDIVHQGVGSLEALAATLLNGPVWYFWWD